MNVMLGKARAPLPPAAHKHDTYRIQNCGLPGVIWANEDGRFGISRGDTSMSFARTLCAETPQGARFALLIPDYLCKATKLPLEFGKPADESLGEL